MPVDWNEPLLRASVQQARQWAGENPIKYSLVFGLPAVAIQALITAGIFNLGGLTQAVLSLVIVPILILAFMVGRTLLTMLYEVRAAMGEHLDPVVAAGTPDNFTCALTDVDSKEIAVRVTNHEAAGEFHAKIVELQGVEPGPVPISVRWRSDDASPFRRINKGDSEVLSVVRVRGRSTIDFLQPRGGNGDTYHRAVAAAPNGERAGPDKRTVGAVLHVFNRRPDGEGRRAHLLEVALDDGADTPGSRLTTLTEDDRGR